MSVEGDRETSLRLMVFLGVTIAISSLVALGLAPGFATVVLLEFPVAAAILWISDGYSWQETASWAVPLVCLTAISLFWSSPLADFLGALAAVFSIGMALSGTIRVAWLSRVWMPFAGRVPRASNNELVAIAMQIGSAHRQYRRDSDIERLRAKAVALSSAAESVRATGPESKRAVDLLKSYLTSLADIAADPSTQPAGAFERLNDQLERFLATVKLADDERRAGRP